MLHNTLRRGGTANVHQTCKFEFPSWVLDDRTHADATPITLEGLSLFDLAFRHR